MFNPKKNILAIPGSKLLLTSSEEDNWIYQTISEIKHDSVLNFTYLLLFTSLSKLKILIL